MNRKLVKLLVLMLFALVVAGETQPAKAQNLLQNPGFEHPYQTNGEANSWGRWHRNSSQDQFGDCANGYHKLPHWSAESNSALRRDGGASQHVGNMWDTWSAGVFQTVPVTAGATYRFTVWAYSFGSSNDFPGPSDGTLNSNVRVGIDPNGSGLWNDSDVVWGGTINPLDGWQQASVEVTATGNQISVFTSANWGVQGVNQCRKHLDTWFDQAELIAVTPPATNTPVPPPTQPPAPVIIPTNPPPATNTPEPEPTATAVPTDTPAPTETPVTTSICVNAYSDDNANGSKDPNEGYMGGVTFTIATSTTLVGQAVSTGTDTPICFEGLEPGQYIVSQIVPASLQLTTASSASIGVAAGETRGLEFGSRIIVDSPTAVSTEVANLPDGNGGQTGETLQPTPPPTAVDESGGTNWVLIGGIALMAIAVLLLGGVFVLLLRGQKGGA